MLGQKLGPYLIESELGAGGMGTVYLAKPQEPIPGLPDGDSVAVKVVHAHLLEQRGFFKRFLREAEIGRQVEHPNVVRTLDVDALAHEGKQFNFLVMEYVEGQNLRSLLEELSRVPEELCLHIAREITKALGAIHDAGVVHRDLKPENVLITEDHVVKLMDLGVARLQDEVIRLSQSGAFVGSVLYAAPEQFKGGGAGMDGRADLYALGLTLYELSTGKHPFADEDLRAAMRRQLQEEARPPAELNPQLSPYFEEVIKTLLAKEPEARFKTAAELLDVLEQGEDSDWWKERAKSIRADTHQPLRRVRIPRETALHGRDEELAKLQSRFDQVKSGAGQVLIVEGEAGIGKTRLVDEFVGRLRQEGEDLNFLFGAYPPGGAATAAGAFSTAYREHFGTESLEPELNACLTETPLLIPAFAALLRGDATPAGSEALTRDSLQTVFVHVTRALATQRPTIVLIDDLHYAPQDGQALFAALAQAIADHRVLLVGTAREGLPEEWLAGVERLAHVSHMNLSRLGPKDVGKLLLDVFRSRRLAEELGFQVLTKSDGNPFFVFEIVRGLREGKFITQNPDGTWAKTAMIQDIQIPSSIVDLVEARISDLDEDERDVLDAASCCGFEFDPSLVAEALGHDIFPALKRFGRIEKRHRLIRSAGRRYVFDHHQVQEALYTGLFEQLREHYHAALGEALESREKAADRDPSELDGKVAVELCEHFLNGARGDRGVRYLDAALSHLEAGYLHGAVVALAGRALSVPGLLAGNGRWEMLQRTATRLSVLGNHSQHLSVLEEALALAEELEDPAAKADANRHMGNLLTNTGRFDEALARLDGALALAVEAGDGHSQAQAMCEKSHTLMRLGRYEESTVVAGRALEIASDLDDLDLEGHAHGCLGNAARPLGRFDDSRRHHERVLAIAEEQGKLTDEATAEANLGVVSAALGHLVEMTAHWERAIELARQVGARRSQAICSSNLGQTVGWMGDWRRARDYLHAAKAMAQEIALSVIEWYATCALGEIADQDGNAIEAERLINEALTGLRAIQARPQIAEALVALGRFLIDRGREAEARPHLDVSLELAKEMGSPGELGRSASYLALLPGGDVGAAVDTVLANESRMMVWERMEARFVLWRATRDRTHLEEAHRLMAHLTDHAPEEYRDSMVENVPLLRDIAAAWAEAQAG